ncbi:MAG: hypothetical protein ACKV19_09215 [Verrucomicrobiales bacterium]
MTVIPQPTHYLLRLCPHPAADHVTATAASPTGDPTQRFRLVYRVYPARGATPLTTAFRLVRKLRRAAHAKKQKSSV